MNKKRRISILVIGIVAISGFSIGYITSILISNNIPHNDPKLYIATDDIQFVNANPRLDINQSKIRIGYYGMNIGTNWVYDFLIKFDLTDKPQDWSKCEFQIYKSSIHPAVIGNPLLRLMLCELNWTDETIDWRYHDLYQYYTWRVDLSHTEYLINYNENGFQRFDITDYIMNNETITVGSRSILTKYESWVYIYSTEANIGNEYKPQLIWS